MFLFGGVLGLVAFGVWMFCIIDAITTPADQVRNLPKLAWIAVVVLLVDLGSIAWLIAGRPWNARATTPRTGGSSTSVGSGLPATAPRRGRARPTNPDDDDEFLADLARRNREQRDRDQRRRDGNNPGSDSGTEPGDGATPSR